MLLDSVTFVGLLIGASSKWYITVDVADTGWNKDAYLTVSASTSSAAATSVTPLITGVAGCNPEKAGSQCSGSSYRCLVNTPIAASLISPEKGGSLTISATVNRLSGVVCSTASGNSVSVTYTLTANHGVPTASPTPGAPLLPGQTYSPTLFPTAEPTAPSPQPSQLPTVAPTAMPSPFPSAAPSQFPTFQPLVRLSYSAGTSTQVNSIYTVPEHTFSGLGAGRTYYLSVDIYGTGFGSGRADLNYATISVNGKTIMQKCNPGNTCDEATDNARLATRCVANHPIAASSSPGSSTIMDPALGGSVTVSTITAGFSTTSCHYNGSAVFVTYSLWASQLMPTNMPTQQPTPATLGAAAGAGGAQSVKSVVSSSGAPFVVVAGVAGLLAALSILLAQSKGNKLYRDHVHELSLFASIVQMTLIGSSLASEFFLMAAMLNTRSTAPLGLAVLMARLAHLPAALYLFKKMFVRSSAGDPPPFGDLLEQDMILQSSKLWGAVALVSMFDVTVLRFFPWLESEFATKSDGFPNAQVFMVSLSTKLFQSCVTVACQASYFLIVNAGADLSSMSASFLILNMISTSLLVVLNGMEMLMKRGILLSGTLKTAADAQESGLKHQPSRRPFSVELPSLRRLSAGSSSFHINKSAASSRSIRDPSVAEAGADYEGNDSYDADTFSSILGSGKSSRKTGNGRDVIPRPSAAPIMSVYGTRGSALGSTFNPLALAAPRISAAAAAATPESSAAAPVAGQTLEVEMLREEIARMKRQQQEQQDMMMRLFAQTQGQGQEQGQGQVQEQAEEGSNKL